LVTLIASIAVVETHEKVGLDDLLISICTFPVVNIGLTSFDAPPHDVKTII
jgi:hypothetical protein